ncbi:MAG: peptidoglycan DD-metalloendopeptidase family protein [Betaproteobacteria bacterium]|nr:peptidoglycan DD-metalloendopeptidase family protein [Betaproteobacteria bacterium]
MGPAAAACVIAFAAALAASASAAPDDDDLAALRSRIDALRADMEAGESTRREARDALRESEGAISDANRSLRELDAERRAVREELARAGAARDALAASTGRQRVLLGRLLASRYLAGPPDALRAVLAGGDPNELPRRLYYLGELSRASARLIERMRSDLAEQLGLEERSRERAARLDAIEAERRTERQKLLAQGREHRRLLEQLAAEIRRQRRELKGLLADDARLTRLVQEIGLVIRARPKAGFVRNESVPVAGAGGPFSALRGQLRLPVRGELPGRSAGQRKGDAATAKGVFIRAREGDAVRSVAAGRVVFADWMRGFGNLLIVDHGEAYLSIYANNESLLKQSGDEVAAGDTVATVGMSGGREESGLYFEIRHLGQAIDPLHWVTLK